MQYLQINKRSKVLLNITIHKGTSVAGQACSIGGAMKEAGGYFPATLYAKKCPDPKDPWQAL